MAGKITEMTDGSALAATDRFEITRDPTGTPLTRWIDGADVTARVLADFPAASLTVTGKVELATTAEMDAGTDAGRAMNVNDFSASDFGTKEIGVEAFASDADVATGNGTTGIPIPASMDGYNVVGVLCTVHTKGITNTTDVVVRKRSGGIDTDVLSTPVTIGDEFFASDGTIDTGEDDVATGDNLYIDVDAVHSGTAPKGLSVVILLRKP